MHGGNPFNRKLFRYLFSALRKSCTNHILRIESAISESENKDKLGLVSRLITG